MVLKFRGLCSGTETKISKKSGQPYQITRFVEMPSLKTFEVFGDLGIPVTMEPTDWELQGDIENVSNVQVLGGPLKQKK